MSTTILPRLDPRRFTLATACDAYRALKSIDGHGKVDLSAR